MKKVKKISIILSLILVVGLFIILLKNNKDEKIEQTKNQNRSGLLTFMLEKKDGSGYEENTATAWPSSKEYVFNSVLSKCENGSEIKYNEKDKTIDVYATKSDRCYVYFDNYTFEKYCKYKDTDSLVCDILRKKDNTIIYHDGKSDYKDEKNVNLEADDLSYRYTGASKNVNNYICFGSVASECPADNLYRIIGFFKNSDGEYETKLIKADYANKNLLGTGTTKPSGTPDYSANGSFYSGVYSKPSGTNEEKDAYTHRYRGSLLEVNRYRWQENGTTETAADWPTALLNTIHLNHNFLGTFNATWQDKIVDYKWHYKGSSWGNIVIGNKTSKNTIRTAYDYEVGSKADTTLTEPTKIGLMYVSDYLYAASPNNWSLKPYNGTYGYQSGDPDSEGNPQGTYNGTDVTDYRSAIDENWMYMGLWEWTITQRTEASGVYAFRLLPPGIAGNDYVGEVRSAVRPVLYLKSSVKLKGGTGSASEPYLIS